MVRRVLALSLGLAFVLSMSGSPGAQQGKTAPDLVGMPDLQVRKDMLGGQWVVRRENLSPNACSVVEGDVTPGERLLVRFTVGIANIGDADVYIGDPQKHIDANDGLFEFALCHQHYHFRNYAKYELIDPATGTVWRAAKRGFCMLDTDPNPAWLTGAPGPGFYRSCGSTSHAGNQGVSAGWTDTYRFFLGGQYFVLDGGDGQPPVPAGRYIIRITANPPFTPSGGEPCPYTDGSGACHMLEESNYANNTAEAEIEIPAHPGRGPVGPLSDAAIMAEPNECHAKEKKE
ncbi:MAG TPA: lysyl oxidase family protein [Vicinamibacterales bacterium]|nr:lysyl oxidase family protein [Vicinamibacterales bacterium]